ncbi:hypothetical protein DL768_010343 [Monosporascus sp. mg162]|nr:hypothetical protein DL768_010343 [Monosporascus sp. mg162]
MSTSAEATVPTPAQQLQKRVQQLEAHIQQLTAQAAASVDSVSTAVTPKLKVKKPEPYDGTGSVQGFLTQARVYLRLERIEGDADRILIVAGFLKGDALNWFEPTLRDYLENAKDDQETAIKKIFESYVNFEQKLKDNFDNPDAERKAAQNLLQLKQKGPTSKYAVEFRNLMSKAGWVDDKDDTLIDVFYKGLKDDVKDEIIKIERPSAFDKYIAKAVKIDNRQFERRQERRGQFAPRSKFQEANQGRKRLTPSTSYGTQPGLMELGAIQSKERNTKDRTKTYAQENPIGTESSTRSAVDDRSARYTKTKKNISRDGLCAYGDKALISRIELEVTLGIRNGIAIYEKPQRWKRSTNWQLPGAGQKENTALHMNPSAITNGAITRRRKN